jgi:hypothetical protein
MYGIYKQDKYNMESTMRKQTKSILQELHDISISRNPAVVIESRGSNLIQSVINLLEMVHQQYDQETANEIEKRFISSVKTRNVDKFARKMRTFQVT